MSGLEKLSRARMSRLEKLSGARMSRLGKLSRVLNVLTRETIWSSNA